MPQSSYLFINTTLAPVASLDPWGYMIDPGLDTDALAGGGYVTSWLADTNHDGQADTIGLQRFDANGVPQGTAITLAAIPQAAFLTADSDLQPAVSIDPLANGGYAVSYEVLAPQTGFGMQLTGTGNVIDVMTVGEPRAYNVSSPGGSLAGLSFALVGADPSGNRLSIPLAVNANGGSGQITVDQSQLSQFANSARAHLTVTGLATGANLYVSGTLGEVWSYDNATPLTTASAGISYVSTGSATNPISVAVLYSQVGRVESFDLNGLTATSGLTPFYQLNVIGTSDLVGRLGLQPPQFGQQSGTPQTIDGLTYRAGANGVITISGSGLTPDINGIIKAPIALLNAIGSHDASIYLAIVNTTPNSALTVQADISYRAPTVIEEGLFTQTYDASGHLLTPPNIDTHSPVVNSFLPADSATSVTVASNIVLTFSEAITRGAGAITLHSGSATGAIVEIFDAATSNRISISGSTLTIDPTSNLAESTQYFLVFATDTIRDVAGNAYAGISTYDFTTIDATPPTVSSIAYGQNDGALALGEVVTLTVTFSEAVKFTGTPTIALANGGTATYAGSTGPNSLTFSYTAAAGQNTAD